jgi:hypothetical protein
MASEESEEIDFDYWDKLIKETEDINELKSFKGKNSVVDGLIDEELEKREDIKKVTIKDDYTPPPEPFEEGFIQEEKENELEELEELEEGFIANTIEGEEEWIEKTPSSPSPIKPLDEEDVDEDIDEEFVINDENEGEDDTGNNLVFKKQEKEIFDKKIYEEDLYIILFKEEDEIVDKLLTIKEINEDQHKLSLIDEEQNDITIQLEDKTNRIILKTDDYEIIDIEKVEEFDLQDLDEEDLLITKNIYPEIELYVDEIKDRKYSIQERKEDFISEMISLFKAYNNETLIKKICNYADTFLFMYDENRNKKEIKDQSIHPFIKKIIQENNIEFPNWIIPIISNIKKLYKEDEEDKTDYDDIKNLIYEEEFLEKVKLFNDNDSNKTYKISTQLLDNYSPYINSSDKTLIPYNGHYIRHCSDKEPCHGIIDDYNLEINKTREELIIAKMKDYKTLFEVIRPEEELTLSGFYTIPYNFLNITYKNNDLFNLIESCQLSDYKYSYRSLKSRFNHNSVIPHIIGTDTIKDDFWNEAFHAYIFNDTVETQNIQEVLTNNFPSITDIINSIPKKLMNNIFNLTDFAKLLYPYGLTYGSLDQENKKAIQGIIKDNIKEYIKNYNQIVKRKVIKNIKKKNVIFSTDEKIKLAKEYIFSLFILPIKNNYIERLIKKYSREALTKDENPNYLYQKDSDKQLLCKHYLYSTKIHKDPSYHSILLNNFGGPANNGMISCQVCGEYLCHEDFSTLEGFGDGGAPINNREELITNDEELKALSEKEINIKKRISKISSLLSIQLNYIDKQSIVDYIQLVNHDELTDIRYNDNEFEKKHPLYKEIKEKYPIIKQIRTKEDQNKNKENKKNKEKELTNFKEYLKDCNELFIITFFILFHIQTSNPPYSIKTKENIYLWDPELFINTKWNKEKHTIHEKLSMDTIELMIDIFNKISSSNKSKFWKNVNTFLNEKTKYQDITNFKEQFLFSASYLLRDSNARIKLKNYYNIRNNIGISVYLKENWSSYRPLPDNDTVISINEKVSEQINVIQTHLLKSGSDIKYENISSIQSIEDAYLLPKYKYYDIPYSDILKNEAYERLFNYCVHLHGKTEPKPILNLLINNFINTIEDSTMIENILITAGWNKDKKELDYVDFTELKRVFIIEITDYFKNKNLNEKSTINTYIHIHFNNWNGMLLNGHSKRNYSYKPPNVYPSENFDELLNYEPKEEKDSNSDLQPVNIVKNILKNYCFDENGEINERYSIDDFIVNLLADPSVERDATCFKKIPENKENFEMILDYKIKSKTLKLNDYQEDNYLIESRIHNFIKDNNLTKYSMDETYELFQGLSDLITIQDKDVLSKEYRRLFNMMLNYNNDIIAKIIQFLNTSYEEENLDKSHVNRTPTKSFDGIAPLLSKFLEDTNTLDTNVYSIKCILGRLSSSKEYNIGTVFHDHIPPQWKISETNQKYIQEFINNNEFLIHDDIFIDKKYTTYEGFYKYTKEDKYSTCIRGLLSYINEYYKGGIEDLNGDDKTEYTENYSNIFKKFTFLFIFSKMIDYIDSLKDINSDNSREANDLFSSLEEQNRMENNELIKVCTHLTFDLLIHYIQEFFDTGWINQTELISEKISRQKEQEKQSIINDLESKTAEDRGVTTELQKIGVISWFKDKSNTNLENTKTEDYKTQTESERIDRLKELFNSDPTMLEMMEREDPNILLRMQHDQKTSEEMEQDEGFSQIDEDREDEGLDDPDEDGQYKEI